MENLAEEPKITQKINQKTNKTKLYLKKNKEPELTKIDEFLEYGKFKNIFIDTCVLKDLNKLFLNKADPDKNNDNENNVVGFSIDKNNHTIFKFNKTPHKLEIERFVLPEKNKKGNNKNNDYINDSVGKINLNNISENKGHVNFLKNNYQSESEKSTKKKKHMNSNIVANSSKIKKKLKEKNAATIFEQVNINEILNESKSRKKKKKKSVREKESKFKISDKDDDKGEKKRNKIKEKDNYKEDYNSNTTIVRKNKKSKTKKHNESLQFPKTRIKKRSTNNLHFTNIKKMSIDKYNGDKEDDSLMIDNFKKGNKKYNTKNNNKLRTSTKSCFINCKDDSKSKKNKKKKYIKFRSEIYSKKNQNPINYKNKLMQRKQSENIFNKKKDIDENNSFKNDNENENDILYSDKIDKSKSSKDSNDSSLKSKNKEKKQTNKNNDDLKIFKFESEKFPYNNNKKSESSSELDSKDSEQNKLKISTSKKSSLYQIKKVNDICLGDNINGNNNCNNYNNNVIKISNFSVAKPDSLVSLEYNKKKEDINIVNNINKNQEINKETNIDNNNNNKNIDNENVNNNSNNNGNNNNDDKVICIDNNENDDDKVIYIDTNNLNERKNSKSVKKPCKFFCCL